MTVTEPSADICRTATLLRHLYLALRQVGFDEGQTLAVLGQAAASVLPAPWAPTVRLNLNDINERVERVRRGA